MTWKFDRGRCIKKWVVAFKIWCFYSFLLEIDDYDFQFDRLKWQTQSRSSQSSKRIFKEYLVWRVEDRQFDWFYWRQGEYIPLQPSSEGILCREVYLGLWLDPEALRSGERSIRISHTRASINSEDAKCSLVGNFDCNPTQRTHSIASRVAVILRDSIPISRNWIEIPSQ